MPKLTRTLMACSAAATLLVSSITPVNPAAAQQPLERKGGDIVLDPRKR
jgi:hypothetical protein